MLQQQRLFFREFRGKKMTNEGTTQQQNSPTSGPDNTHKEYYSKGGKNTKKAHTLSRQQIQKHILHKIRHSQGSNLKHKTNLTKKKFRSYLREKQDTTVNNSFQCSVCLEMIMSPSPTPCGHVFCFKCIQEALLHKSVCPICRTHIRSNEFSISKNYQRINNFYWRQHKGSLYKLRQRENADWEKERFLQENSLREGEEIDVCDTEHVWCKAMIKKVFREDGRTNEVLVHYDQWNKIYDEVINVKSQRLAPVGFFSERKDIPRYKLSQHDDNIRGRIGYGRERERTDVGEEMLEQIPYFEVSSDLLLFSRLRNAPWTITYQSSLNPHSIRIGRGTGIDNIGSSSSEEEILPRNVSIRFQEVQSSNSGESVQNQEPSSEVQHSDAQLSQESQPNPQNSVQQQSNQEQYIQEGQGIQDIQAFFNQNHFNFINPEQARQDEEEQPPEHRSLLQGNSQSSRERHNLSLINLEEEEENNLFSEQRQQQYD